MKYTIYLLLVLSVNALAATEDGSGGTPSTTADEDGSGGTPSITAEEDGSGGTPSVIIIGGGNTILQCDNYGGCVVVQQSDS